MRWTGTVAATPLLPLTLQTSRFPTPKLVASPFLSITDFVHNTILWLYLHIIGLLCLSWNLVRFRPKEVTVACTEQEVPTVSLTISFTSHWIYSSIFYSFNSDSLCWLIAYFGVVKALRTSWLSFNWFIDLACISWFFTVFTDSFYRDNSFVNFLSFCNKIVCLKYLNQFIVWKNHAVFEILGFAIFLNLSIGNWKQENGVAAAPWTAHSPD